QSRPPLRKAVKLLKRAEVEGHFADDAAAKPLGSLVSSAFASSYRRFVAAVVSRASAYLRWGTLQVRSLNVAADFGAGRQIHPSWLATWPRDDSNARRLALAADARFNNAVTSLGAVASREPKPVSTVAKLNPSGFFATVLAKAQRG